MATETEIKLSLSATAARQLSELPLLAGSGRSSKLLVNTYYDTPDRRLRSEHMVVRYRRQGRQCLLGVKTAPPIAAGLAQRGEWEAPGQPGDFDFGHVDSIAVRALLESLREELQPVFTTRFRRDAYVVAPRPGVRIEVALDRGRIDAGGIRQSIREVELELLSGSLNDLFAVALDLQASLPMHPEASSKSERAYRLLDGAALIAVKAQPVAVHPEMQTMAAFRLIALACIGHLQSNEQGVCLSDGAEFVHQARVAIRRLRSAIRLWEPLLPEPFVARFDPLWQALATQLGDNRNWDVFRVETLPLLVEAFAGRVDGARLESRVYGRCASSHRVSRRALQSEDYSRLLLDFTAELVALPASPAGLLADFVPRCLSKRARRVNERAAAPLQADVAARHRLRVAVIACASRSSSCATGSSSLLRCWPIRCGPNTSSQPPRCRRCSGGSTTLPWRRNWWPQSCRQVTVPRFRRGWRRRPNRCCRSLRSCSTISSDGQRRGSRRSSGSATARARESSLTACRSRWQ
ncbi:MAG: hypothetical protein AW12_00206 [Candidatus Accumulibacter sp. BA-94]|nr:MAG: hypothetical protein AW12_00206 [Candidatus Accumulibacter sp. BA-94]